MPTLTRPLFRRSAPGKADAKAPPARGSLPSAVAPDIAHDYRRRVGAWICSLRIEAGLTQAELAAHLGVGNTAISAIEVGRGSVPPENYEAMADILGVPLEDFGKTMLRFSNPWAYAAIFGKTDKTLKAELEDLPRRGKPKPKTPQKLATRL